MTARPSAGCRDSHDQLIYVPLRPPCLCVSELNLGSVSSVPSIHQVLLHGDPIKRPPPPQIEFVTNDCRRRIEPVIEAIDGQRFRRLAVLQDDNGTVSAGDVDASIYGDGRRIEIGDVAEA